MLKRAKTSACQTDRLKQLLSSAEMPCLPVEGKRAFIFINDVGIEFECTYLDKELVAFELDEPGDPASVAAAL